MPRNIEIKAAVSDFRPIMEVLVRLTAEPPEELWHEDTYFPCRNGRLKLRRFAESSGELIHYRRADDAAPKESNYLRIPIREPDRLGDLLECALGTLGVVRKHRMVYLVGRTRVHLDDVERLGKFLELEVVLAESESSAVGVEEANRLMSHFGIHAERLVSGSYIDLMNRFPRE